MKKRILSMALALMIAVSVLSLNVFAAEDNTMVEIEFCVGDEILMINGEAVTVEKPYVVGEGVTLVPVRVITEAFGAQVGWIDESQTVTLEYPDVNIVLQIGNPIAEVNGKAETLLAAPELPKDTTMVPLRFISENFGAEVSYDPATERITVTKDMSANGESTVEGAIDSKYVGDSFYGWSMENPVDAVMDYRYFDGSYTSFTYDDYNWMNISIYKLDDEYDFDKEYNDWKTSFTGYTLSKADKDVSDANKKEMLFQARDKSETVVVKIVITDKYEYYVNGSFSNESTDVKNAGITVLESFDAAFTGEDIYDLSNVENGVRKFESEFLKLSFDVPQEYLMLSSEEAENDFLFVSENENDGSGISAAVYSKTEDVNAKALAEKDYGRNKKAINAELATFHGGVTEKTYGDITGYEYVYELAANDINTYDRDFFFDLGDYVYNIHMSVNRENEDKEKIADTFMNSIKAEKLDPEKVGTIIYTNDTKTGTTAYDDVTKCEFSVNNAFSEVYVGEDGATFYDENLVTQIAMLCDTSEDYTYSMVKNQLKQIENTNKKMDGVTIVESTTDKMFGKKKYASLLMKVVEDGTTAYVQQYITENDGFAYVIVVTYHELGYSEYSRNMVNDFMNSIKFK